MTYDYGILKWINFQSIEFLKRLNTFFFPHKHAELTIVLNNWFTFFFLKVFLSPSEVEGNTGWLNLCDAIVSSGATGLTDRVNP